MTMKVTISDMGDSTLLLNEMVDIRTLNKINNQLENDNKNKLLSEPVLLGITRASLNTESFRFCIFISTNCKCFNKKLL